MLLACAPDHDPLDSVTASMTATASPGSTSAPDDPTTGASSPDVGSSQQACDQWLEDCPEGQKCMPASLDGDNAWESHICTPLVREPDGVGEPCVVIGSVVSGEDTCGVHTMCWDVDPDTLEGTCVAMCTGSPVSPECDDPDAVCTISGDATLILCLPVCDPLAQDCPPGDTCIPYSMGTSFFTCALDASGDAGQLYDPCEYANVCDPGLYCLNSELADECDPMSPGCCLPFCNLEGPQCPGIGQECLPWYEDGEAPPGFEDVGVCGLPPG